MYDPASLKWVMSQRPYFNVLLAAEAMAASFSGLMRLLSTLTDFAGLSFLTVFFFADLTSFFAIFP